MHTNIVRTNTLRVAFFLCLSGLSENSFSRHEVYKDLIFFPHIEVIQNSGLEGTPRPYDDDYLIGVDLFGTLNLDRFLVLGEILLANHEKDVERLQLGFLFNHDNRLWVGRFHNPLGFWNTHYHHGDYLETGIRRPSIAEFEDDGGILPMHLAGLLYEGSIEFSGQKIGYEFAFGAGPGMEEEGLEPLSVIRPGHGKHDVSTTFNLYYEPGRGEFTDYGDYPSQIGIFLNYTELPAEEAGFDEIHMLISGAYLNWNYKRWHISGSFYFIHNHFDLATGSFNDSFATTYLQGEYHLNDTWAIFTRGEATINEDNDSYLSLFPDYVEDRLAGGIRYDFLMHHALKLEASGNHAKTDDYLQVILQWSAAF